MPCAIKVENLSKKYLLSHQKRERYVALRDVIASKVKQLSRPRPDYAPVEEFWALKDVSFEVRQGDRIGIIGRNGAGKSTLLKILSRITEPSSGAVKIRGRVASLLEVGTGFHPELTGRENIFLNGAILGMSNAEIRRKFDEIVDFAEVEQFLDTPVKRYSSGMYVRLAFAVAAHMEPEILVVDEVLAVGDAAFQKKCLHKMKDVSGSGRTVLFVSHNMAAISQLCGKGILLDKGRIQSIGDVGAVVSDYMSNNAAKSDSVDLRAHTQRSGTGEARLEWAKICDTSGSPRREFSMGEDFTVAFQLKTKESLRNKQILAAIHIKRADGLDLCHVLNSDSHFEIAHIKETEEISAHFKDIRFYPDTYYIGLCIASANGVDVFDNVDDCLSFDITDGGSFTTRNLPRASGLLLLTPQWLRRKE